MASFGHSGPPDPSDRRGKPRAEGVGRTTDPPAGGGGMSTVSAPPTGNTTLCSLSGGSPAKTGPGGDERAAEAPASAADTAPAGGDEAADAGAGSSNPSITASTTGPAPAWSLMIGAAVRRETCDCIPSLSAAGKWEHVSVDGEEGGGDACRVGAAAPEGSVTANETAYADRLPRRSARRSSRRRNRSAALARSILLGPWRNPSSCFQSGLDARALTCLLSASHGTSAKRPRQSPRRARSFFVGVLQGLQK